MIFLKIFQICSGWDAECLSVWFHVTIQCKISFTLWANISLGRPALRPVPGYVPAVLIVHNLLPVWYRLRMMESVHKSCEIPFTAFVKHYMESHHRNITVSFLWYSALFVWSWRLPVQGAAVSNYSKHRSDFSVSCFPSCLLHCAYYAI